MYLIKILFFILIISHQAFAWNTRSNNPIGANYQFWTWTGAGGNSNWNNGNNWCGAYLSGSCRGAPGGPPASAHVIFDDSCIAYSNCNPVMPGGNITLSGLTMRPNFTGNISQGATNLTIGSKGFTIDSGTFTGGTGTILLQDGTLGVKWTMRGGNFVGGSGNITMIPASGTTTTNTVVFSAGDFTSTTGNLALTASNINIAGLASYTHNGGTFTLNPISGTDMGFTGAASLIFNDVTFLGNGTSILLYSPIVMDGNVRFNNNGSTTLYVRGNKINLRQGNAYHTGASVAGSGQVVFMKDNLQLLDKSLATSTNFIGIELANAAGGSVRLIGNVRFCGSVTGTATLGTLDVNGAIVSFGSNGFTDSTFDLGSTIELPYLLINGDTDLQKFGTVKVSGDVDINQSSGGAGNGGGSIIIGGNVTVTGGTFSHTVSLHMKGSTAQTITFLSTGRTLPGLRLENSGGGVTISHDPTFTGPVAYVSGGFTVPAVVRFNNTSITSNGLVWNTVHFTNGGATISINDVMSISGDMHLPNASASVLSGSSINLSGNYFISGSGGYYGNTIVKLVGTNQTVTSNSGGYMPSIEIATTSGTTTLVGSFKLQTSGMGFRYTSGTVDSSGLTSIDFNLGSGSTTGIVPGPVEFNNVSLSARSIPITGTMIVKGNLTLSANSASFRTLTGNIDVYGNVTSSGNGMSGAGTITFKGSTDTTLSNTATAFPSGMLQFSKSAGRKVSLISSLTLATNQSVSVTSGSLDIGAGGQTLAISGTGSLTLAATTTVKLSGGSVTVGGTPLTTGAYSGGTIVP